MISITVQDDGVGIPAEALPRIFDPFYTTKRPGGGTGLGLSICMSIIREHGGNLDAKALPGGGSLFTLDLPALPVVEKDADELEATSTAAAANAALATPKKDLSAIRAVEFWWWTTKKASACCLEEGLSTHGLEVDCAANAEAALALVPGRSYDILLCDLNLAIAGGGKVSGRDVANNILQASGPEKPSVIFMTGDLVAPESAGSATGEPRLLQKPFRISDVLATVQEVCALKQLETPSK